MAAGKTTAVRYAAERLPLLHASYEDPIPAWTEITARGLRQDTLPDFIEIQRVFIRMELQRHAENSAYPYVLQDLGPEEIEFFSLLFPNAMGFDWNIKDLLAPELSSLQGVMPDRILYLDAGAETLEQNVRSDAARRHGHFDRYVRKLLPLKMDWMRKAHGDRLDVLSVDGLSAEQVGEAVVAWAMRQIK